VESTICNSNWTEWSTSQGVIVRVISKSDECIKHKADLNMQLYSMRSNY